jgi:Ca-activated chloride channel family protein
MRQAGTSITALGLGNDYDTTLMTQLARDTGGAFHYIERPDQVADVFDRELSRMTTVVGGRLNLALAPGPGVLILPMHGIQIQANGKVVMGLGDLAAGETRDLMIPIKVTARGDGATAELMDAQLSFLDVIGKSGQQLRDGFVAVKTSHDPAAVRDAIKIDLEVARVRAMAASATLEAMQLARGGQVEAGRARLAQAIAIVRAAATRLRDAELGKLATELERVSQQLTKLTVQIVRPVASAGGDAPSPAPATATPDIERDLRSVEAQAHGTASGRTRR